MTRTVPPISALLARGTAPACGRCGEPVPVGPDAVGAVCWRCTTYNAHIQATDPAQVGVPSRDRACPDCGGALAAGQRYCRACAVKRRRASKRASFHKARPALDS